MGLMPRSGVKREKEREKNENLAKLAQQAGAYLVPRLNS